MQSCTEVINSSLNEHDSQRFERISGDLTFGDLDLIFSGKLRNSCPNSCAAVF